MSCYFLRTQRLSPPTSWAGLHNNVPDRPSTKVARQRPRPTFHQGCTATSQTDLPPRLHGNVPDRPSTKVAPVGCQLVTMTLQIKTVTIPKGWVARQKLSPNLGRRCIWTELHETGGLSATLAVNRLGCFRATRPWDFDPRLIFTKVPLRT